MVSIKDSLERLYIGSATVYTYQDTFDQSTKQTTQSLQSIPSLTSIPCRLSFSTLAQVKYLYENSGVPNQTQIIKLFLDPSYDIPAGSVIKVEQNGFMEWYKNSGKSAIHTNHQEIILELLEEH